MSSIIIKTSKTKNSAEEKRKIYTWSACGLLALLVIFTALSKSSPSDSRKSSYEQYMAKSQDLAELPFATDAAASEFLQYNPDYKQASNTDMLNSLFSTDDRKARQEADKKEGIPSAPDEEYAAAEQEKKMADKKKSAMQERIDRAKTRRAEASKRLSNIKEKQTARNNQRTSSGSLTAGKGSTVSSSSSVSNVWKSADKNKYGNSDKGNTAITKDMLGLKAGDIAAAKKYGRNSGFYDALAHSSAAANADNLDDMAAQASAAFQGGDEKDLEALDADDEGTDKDITTPELTDDLLDDAKNVASDLGKDLDKSVKKDQEKKKNENKADCTMMKGGSFWKCLGKSLLVNMVSRAGDALVNAGTSWITKDTSSLKDSLK